MKYKTILLALLSITTISSYSKTSTVKVNCIKNPLYCHILSIKPAINRKFAFKLSNLLVYYARKYKMDPWRSLAIAIQESSLKATKRYETVYIPVKKCNQKQCKTYFRSVKGISDLGYFQLHARTVKHHKFNPRSVLENLNYMVKSHYIVLAEKIQQCRHLGKDAWSCYHSKTPILRKKYLHKVNRYYPSAHTAKLYNYSISK